MIIKGDKILLERLMKRLVDNSVEALENKEFKRGKEIGDESRALYRAITKIYYGNVFTGSKK